MSYQEENGRFPMTGNLPRKHNICQSHGCVTSNVVTKFVKEGQILREENEQQFVPGCDEDDRWSCQVHGRCIKYVCTTHHVPVCETCASIDHRHPCTLEDVTIHERQTTSDLKKLQKKLESAEHDLEVYTTRMDDSAGKVAKRFSDLQRSVSEACIKRQRKVMEEKAKRDCLAREISDEKIRKIRQDLEKQLLHNEAEAHRTCESIHDATESLLSKLKTTRKEIQSIPDQLAMMSRKKMHDVRIVIDKINTMLTYEELLLANGDIMKVIEDMALVDMNTDVADKLDDVTEAITFVERENVEVGILSGMEGFWNIKRTISLKPCIRLPLLLCAVTATEVVVTDTMRRTLHMINTEDKTTECVIGPSTLSCVSDCALMDNGKIVCGNASTGSLFIFNLSSWKHTDEIHLLEEVTSSFQPIHLDVDIHGNICASVFGQPHIFIIDPKHGILRKITLLNCPRILNIHTLSSGDVLVQSSINSFILFDDTFHEKKLINRAHWETAQCTVDKLTDVLYITYKEVGEASYAVDAVLPEGELISEYRIRFTPSIRADCTPKSHCLEYGKLVICDGEKMHIYEKTLGVRDLNVLKRSPLFSPISRYGSEQAEYRHIINSEIFV